MVARQWTAGNNPTAVTPRGVFVLESGMEELAQSCWEKMSQGADLQRLLQDMASFYATDLSALPSFVAIIEDGTSAHVAVRGPFELVVDTAKGPSSITSGSVITWAEHRLSEVKGWRISGIVPTDHDKDTQWVIESGVVPLTTISSGVVGVVEAEMDDAAAPTSRETEASEHPGEADTELAPSSVDPSPSRRRTDLEDTEELPNAAASAEMEEDGGVYSFFKSLGLGVDQGRQVDHADADASEQTPNSDPEKPTPATDETPGGQDVSVNAPSSEETRVDTGDTRYDDWNYTQVEVAVEEPVEAAASTGTQTEPEERSEYDVLFEETRMRPVEDAAVREVRNSDVLDEPAQPATAHPSLPDMISVLPATGLGQPLESPASPESAMAAFPPPTGLPGQPASPPAFLPDAPDARPHVYEAQVSPPPPVPTGGFFIDSVPGVSAPSAPVEPQPPLEEGDHDGHTIVGGKASQFHDLARQIAQHQGGSVPAGTQGGGPMVLAILCNVGHPNPTHATSCRSCGGALSAQTTSVPRPTLGRLVFSTGETITLDRDVVVGRRPRAAAEPGRQEPQIVPVPSPKQEISRTHCQIRVDDWEVRVKDMGSNNGTYLTRPGEAALRLSEKTPMILQVGDRLDLGEGISIRMEA